MKNEECRIPVIAMIVCSRGDLVWDYKGNSEFPPHLVPGVDIDRKGLTCLTMEICKVYVHDGRVCASFVMVEWATDGTEARNRQCDWPARHNPARARERTRSSLAVCSISA